MLQSAASALPALWLSTGGPPSVADKVGAVAGFDVGLELVLVDGPAHWDTKEVDDKLMHWSSVLAASVWVVNPFVRGCLGAGAGWSLLSLLLSQCCVLLPSL